MTRRREHRVAVMAKPVLVVVDDEDTSLQALTHELESRYGVHYQVVSGSSAKVALARDIFPTARRGLLISWSDQSRFAPFLEAAALGWLEFYLPKPTRSPDE